MEFRELNYVLAIARYQNISRAAESLYITQPTLSKFLITLENELGQKLFQRVGNRYVLTYAGQIYVEKAHQILTLKTDMERAMEDIKDTGSGVLNVAIPSTRCANILPQALPSFQKTNPNIRLTVFEGNSVEIRRRLLDGDVDLAFSGMPMDKHPSLDYLPLWSEEMVIITSENHPLSNYAISKPDYPYPVLDLGVLSNEIFLKLMPYQRTRQLTDALLQAQRIEFSNTMSTGSLSAIIDLVAVGYGVSIVFDSPHIHRPSSGGICCYCMEKRNLHDFAAVTRKNSYISESARSFIHLLKELHDQGRV